MRELTGQTYLYLPKINFWLRPWSLSIYNTINTSVLHILSASDLNCAAFYCCKINRVNIRRVSYLIYVSMRHYVLTTSGDIVVCFHTAVCLSCWFVNYVMAFSFCYWANYTNLYSRENEVIPEVRKRRGGWPGFEVSVWRRPTSCWILSEMSPEIQEWSHKSRSRINNLYLLTRLYGILT